MSYLVLARKYRPQTFDEVYAQDHITSILKNSITMDRIAQAFLFTGTRGVGKTSMARIFAKSLNCLKNGPTPIPCNDCENCISITKGSSQDVVEIDGASNTGVDDIRDLQRELMYATSNAKYKIYIIDEVHMLSKSAFNALLKTLEEPPPNVIFMFATTEPHKVLPTIISRCQRFDFKRIPIPDIISQLKEICVKEKINIEDEALFLIARKADGSMRDALSLMDQVFAYGNVNIKLADVLSIFGIIHHEVYQKMIEAILKRQTSTMISLLHQTLETGTDIQEFINGMLDYFRYLLLLQLNLKISEITPSQQEIMKKTSEQFTDHEILYLMSMLIQTKTDIRNSSNPLLIAEMSFIKLTKLAEMKSIEELIKICKEKQPVSTINLEHHFKRSEKQVHKETIKEKRKIIQEVRSEKPKIENLTKEILNKEIDHVHTKLKKQKLIVANYFKQCKIESIQSNKIQFSIDSNTQFRRLDEEKQLISDVISNHFGLKVRVNFSLNDSPKKIAKRNPSLAEIKKESPKLAHFIETLDPDAEIITDSMI